MQVFVRRSTLTNEAVPILLSVDDTAAIPLEMQRPGLTVLSVAGSAIQNSERGPALEPGWRETNQREIIKGEARRRILEAFPEHEQRNAALEIALLLATHGSGQWPREAQGRKAEIERAWGYINAVRAAAKAMLATGTLPVDPTADAHWPKR
jgi:hypothetical protein